MLDFISYNRINTFVTNLVTVSETITTTPYVDNSPNGVFTSPKGTLLQKRGNILSYKQPGETEFTIINYASNSIAALFDKYSVILNRGVNKNVTWVKTDADPGKSWSNRGTNTNATQICAVCGPTPAPTPTPEPTPTPTSFCPCDYSVVGTMIVNTLIVDSPLCEPAPTDPGTRGQIVICENYLYIHDGTQWKRTTLDTYV